MTAVETPPRVPRMALSSMCRDGKHRTCAELRMRCVCECHGDRPAQPAESATKAAPKPRESAGKSREPATPPRTGFPPVSGGTIGGPAAARADKKQGPVVELVKAEPPEKPRKLSLAEQVRPLLEEILTTQDRDWFRVILFFKANQANFNIKRLVESHSKTEWEWRAVKLVEVDQSAIYVRWVGKDGVIV